VYNSGLSEVDKQLNLWLGSAKPVANSSRLSQIGVKQDFAFSHVGVDFAGPIYVKSVAKGQTEICKAYIVLYTCASTRAVHLELVLNLTADAFIRSFRKFIARRGIPKLIFSDNAKTFKSSSNKLSALIVLRKVQELLELTVQTGWTNRNSLLKRPFGWVGLGSEWSSRSVV
jgi:hypothetical protein